jgi:ribosomal-protein-alanine N-acetyltransferase
MAVCDLSFVEAIEAATQIVPWEKVVFQNCLDVGYDCWVAELENEVIAFAILYIEQVIKEAHVMNICVKPAYQQQGIGRFLLQYLLQYASEQVTEIILEVRKSNKIAFQLYQHIGFKVIGERIDYYPALIGREDAIILSFKFKDRL